MKAKTNYKALVPFIVIIAISRLNAQNGNLPNPLFNYKSESTAAFYSAAGTIIPTTIGIFSPQCEARFWLLSGGILVGPSLSYFYADDPEKGFKSIGTRTMICAGALIFTYVIRSPVVFYSGIGCAILHGVHDTRKALSQIREHNQSQKKLSVNISVRYLADYDAAGISLNINF